MMPTVSRVWASPISCPRLTDIHAIHNACQTIAMLLSLMARLPVRPTSIARVHSVRWSTSRRRPAGQAAEVSLSRSGLSILHDPAMTSPDPQTHTTRFTVRPAYPPRSIASFPPRRARRLSSPLGTRLKPATETVRARPARATARPSTTCAHGIRAQAPPTPHRRTQTVRGWTSCANGRSHTCCRGRRRRGRRPMSAGQPIAW